MKVKECKDEIDIIEEIEGGSLIIEDMEDLEKVKNLARGLARSQGFYGRLLLQLADIIEEDLPIEL